MKIDLLVSFSVTSKTGSEEAIDLIRPILVPDEYVVLAYKHTRDKVWFTDKRIIAMDVQGLTGTKKEFRSFPYSKITSFSIETAGFIDSDSDFKIWVSGVGVFAIKFYKKIDIQEVARFLGDEIL